MTHVSLIGAGKWGRNILRTLREIGALGAVYEANPVVREALSREFPGVEFAESETEALELGEAVAIATSAESHAPLAERAMCAGRHAFVEKPMALSVSEAERLVETADATGKVCMAGHLLLYQPAVEYIRTALREGVIGQVYTFHHERLHHGRARDVENVLWSLGVHDIAVSLYLVGEPPVGVAFSGHAGITPGIEDDTRLDLRFANGARAHIHNSWLWPTLRRELTVIGSDGMLLYDEIAQKVELHRKSIDSNMQLHGKDSEPELAFEGAGRPLELELRHFIECCETGKTPRSDARSALEITRIMEQVSPQVVDFPLSTLGERG